MVSCGTVDLESGGSIGRFEGTERLGEGRNWEKLRATVSHMVNEQEARGTQIWGREREGEVAGGSIDLVNEWQARGNERNRRGGRKKGSGRLC